MLTKKDEEFIIYWESQREVRSKPMNKLLSGLPMAIMFGLPILLVVVLVQFISPEWSQKATGSISHVDDGQQVLTKELSENAEWYQKVTKFSTGTFIVIIIAITLAVLFFAYFRMSYKWEMNEQLYMELKQRQKRPANAG